MSYNYLGNPSEDFEFISAQNKSELDDIVAIKCEKGGEMDTYYGEILENKCILIIFCCGPNLSPQEVVYYQPRRNGLKNRYVQPIVMVHHIIWTI